MSGVALEQRRFKGKRRRPQMETSPLKLAAQLAPRDLHGLLADAAVWLCVDEPARQLLDASCLGNLDGGGRTAAYVAAALAAAGAPPPPGARAAVRLSLDEAFFMAHALEVLTVHARLPSGGGDGVPGGGGGVGGGGGEAAAEPGGAAAAAAGPAAGPALGARALWAACCAARADFALLYGAYRHFRSRGWLPRTGLQYGADYVLYQRHPALAHSDYSVLVLPLRSGPGAAAAGAPGAAAAESGGGAGGGGGGDADPGDEWGRALGWHDLQIANRLSAQVGKRLLLLYVDAPAGGAAAAAAAGPAWLGRLAVQERLVRRWVPESRRGL